MGRWRIVAMLDYDYDFPGKMEPGYILFEDDLAGEFAFNFVTGQIFGGGHAGAVDFSRTGNNRWKTPKATFGPKPSPTPPSRAKRRRSALHGLPEHVSASVLAELWLLGVQSAPLILASYLNRQAINPVPSEWARPQSGSRSNDYRQRLLRMGQLRAYHQHLI